ncbi:MFS transporter [Streptomyces sp. NPDC006140]|uniref:MFS transporter n=1 Tax=Streptomyces sp. NPDC006140 TaxID=3154579 RepID=UPI0033F0568F
MKETLKNYRTVLAVPDARRMIAADALAKAGDWLLYVAISLMLFRSSGVAALGLFNAIRIVIPVLLSPAAGRRGSRYRARDVMAVANIIRAAVLGVTALAAANGAPVVLLMGSVLVCTFSTAWFGPAERRMQRDLTGPQDRAAVFAVLGTTGTLVLVVAPACGAVVSSWLSPSALLGMTAVLFVLATTVLLRVSCPLPPAAATSGAEDSGKGGTVRALRSALAAASADRAVAVALICQAAACWTVGASLVLLLPVAQQAAGQDTALGWLTASIGLGSALGMLLGAPVAQRQQLARGATCIVVLGMLVAALALADAMAVALLVTFAMGLAANIPEPLYWTVYGNRVSEERSGSVYGLVESVISGTMTLGGAVAGVVAGSFGPATAAVVVGATTVAVATAGLRLGRGVRRDVEVVTV